MPDMPGMVRRLGRESTARRLGFARLGRLESLMLESGMHNSDRHHSTGSLAIVRTAAVYRTYRTHSR